MALPLNPSCLTGFSLRIGGFHRIFVATDNIPNLNLFPAQEDVSFLLIHEEIFMIEAGCCAVSFMLKKKNYIEITFWLKFFNQIINREGRETERSCIDKAFKACIEIVFRQLNWEGEIPDCSSSFKYKTETTHHDAFVDEGRFECNLELLSILEGERRGENLNLRILVESSKGEEYRFAANETGRK